MSDKLLLKFRARNTPYGVTRETLKALSVELDMTETMVIHLAVSRFAKEVLPAYEPDEGPLSPGYVAWLRKTAKSRLPKGRVISKKSLL
jgi:hypothetical protein